MKILLIILSTIIMMPSIAFPLTYEKHNTISDIGGVGKGSSESEGYVSYQINDFPLCKKLNKSKIASLRQGARIHYDQHKKIYAFEKGIFDCSYAWENNSTLTSIYEGMVEYFTLDTILIYYTHKNEKAHGYMRQKNIWYTFTHDEKFLFGDSRSFTNKNNVASTKEIKHAERLLNFYNNLDVSTSSAKIYGDVINRNIHLDENKKIAEQTTTNKQSSTNIATELEKLDKLLKSRSITKDEYQKAKNKLLN